MAERTSKGGHIPRHSRAREAGQSTATEMAGAAACSLERCIKDDLKKNSLPQQFSGSSQNETKALGDMLPWFETMGHYSNLLPSSEDYGSGYQRYLSCIVDFPTKNVLEECGLLNWCPTIKELYPLKVDGHGDCLLSAVGRYIWNMEALGPSVLEQPLCETIETLSSDLAERWTQDWQRMHGILPPPSLCPLGKESDNPELQRPVRLFVLANILRRPIIVFDEADVTPSRGADAMAYGQVAAESKSATQTVQLPDRSQTNTFNDTDHDDGGDILMEGEIRESMLPSFARSSFGSGVSGVSAGGVYLPLLVDPKMCRRARTISPVPLIFARGRFEPLVSLGEAPLHNGIHALPLVSRAYIPLNIRFLKMESEGTVGGIEPWVGTELATSSIGGLDLYMNLANLFMSTGGGKLDDVMAANLILTRLPNNEAGVNVSSKISSTATDDLRMDVSRPGVEGQRKVQCSSRRKRENAPDERDTKHNGAHQQYSHSKVLPAQIPSSVATRSQGDGAARTAAMDICHPGGLKLDADNAYSGLGMLAKDSMRESHIAKMKSNPRGKARSNRIKETEISSTDCGETLEAGCGQITADIENEDGWENLGNSLPEGNLNVDTADVGTSMSRPLMDPAPVREIDSGTDTPCSTLLRERTDAGAFKTDSRFKRTDKEKAFKVERVSSQADTALDLSSKKNATEKDVPVSYNNISDLREGPDTSTKRLSSISSTSNKQSSALAGERHGNCDSTSGNWPSPIVERMEEGGWEYVSSMLEAMCTTPGCHYHTAVDTHPYCHSCADQHANESTENAELALAALGGNEGNKVETDNELQVVDRRMSADTGFGTNDVMGEVSYNGGDGRLGQSTASNAHTPESPSPLGPFRRPERRLASRLYPALDDSTLDFDVVDSSPDPDPNRTSRRSNRDQNVRRHRDVRGQEEERAHREAEGQHERRHPSERRGHAPSQGRRENQDQQEMRNPQERRGHALSQGRREDQDQQEMRDPQEQRGHHALSQGRREDQGQQEMRDPQERRSYQEVGGQHVSSPSRPAGDLCFICSELLPIDDADENPLCPVCLVREGPQEPLPCVRLGCDMFGTPSQDGLCSQCWKRWRSRTGNGQVSSFGSGSQLVQASQEMGAATGDKKQSEFSRNEEVKAVGTAEGRSELYGISSAGGIRDGDQLQEQLSPQRPPQTAGTTSPGSQSAREKEMEEQWQPALGRAREHREEGSTTPPFPVDIPSLRLSPSGRDDEPRCSTATCINQGSAERNGLCQGCYLRDTRYAVPARAPRPSYAQRANVSRLGAVAAASTGLDRPSGDLNTEVGAGGGRGRRGLPVGRSESRGRSDRLCMAPRCNNPASDLLGSGGMCEECFETLDRANKVREEQRFEWERRERENDARAVEQQMKLERERERQEEEVRREREHQIEIEERIRAEETERRARERRERAPRRFEPKPVEAWGEQENTQATSRHLGGAESSWEREHSTTGGTDAQRHLCQESGCHRSIRMSERFCCIHLSQEGAASGTQLETCAEPTCTRPVNVGATHCYFHAKEGKKYLDVIEPTICSRPHCSNPPHHGLDGLCRKCFLTPTKSSTAPSDVVRGLDEPDALPAVSTNQIGRTRSSANQRPSPQPYHSHLPAAVRSSNSSRITSFSTAGHYTDRAPVTSQPNSTRPFRDTVTSRPTGRLPYMSPETDRTTRCCRDGHRCYLPSCDVCQRVRYPGNRGQTVSRDPYVYKYGSLA